MAVLSPPDMQLAPAEPKDGKKATRPVNCFMMFRTFYATMFGKAHQKEISGVICFLWSYEKATNKWIILAKAYSIIRDAQGKAKSPIEVFLAINAPFINVPAPNDYLRAMGWTITAGDNPLMKQGGQVDQAYLATNHTVLDVVQNSVDAGYVMIKDLSKKQFDMMMVAAGREDVKPAAMPESMNYKPYGQAPYYEDFDKSKTTREDFDPYANDEFNIYNVSEMFNSWVE